MDADVAHAPNEYVVVWQRFDNATGTTTNLGETRASTTERRRAEGSAGGSGHVYPRRDLR